MQHFYGCSEDYLLSIPISRFWSKYKNMAIISLQKRIDKLSIQAIASRGDVNKEITKLRWHLERLTGKERVDSLADIRKAMDAARKAGKKKKKKKKQKEAEKS